MKVILVGRVAANGRKLLEAHLRTPCQLVLIPEGSKNPRLLEEIADAEVVVGFGMRFTPSTRIPLISLGRDLSRRRRRFGTPGQTSLFYRRRFSRIQGSSSSSP